LELFVDYGQRHGKSDEELVLERERAVQAPVVIAIVARIDPSARVPAHEQWIAVGGAVANLLNALHFMGFGAKTLSGLRASDPEITKEFCRENEQLVGWGFGGHAENPTGVARGRSGGPHLQRVLTAGPLNHCRTSDCVGILPLLTSVSSMTRPGVDRTS
jgi:hypothetical protein